MVPPDQRERKNRVKESVFKNRVRRRVPVSGTDDAAGQVKVSHSFLVLLQLLLRVPPSSLSSSERTEEKCNCQQREIGRQDEFDREVGSFYNPFPIRFTRSNSNKMK